MTPETPVMKIDVGTFTGSDIRQVVAEIERLTGVKVQLMCGNLKLTLVDHVEALNVPELKELPRESGLPYYRRFERRRY